ncbi:membrane protein / Vitamin K-dependent gamma-carboxylase [Planococcus antarcticus DSM 14505]|uniref:Membrane protein / Vitamin K-dependent gamma-carboxylase n=1 Tax=Planococcus antarcticus DSM 14505 TaxID=1185653 RepID=A0AA87LUJ1_9BACL|nr:hypothetical protein [Planococcus antarcticus]EIM08414.1 membrane protein / Vitamin K-dependent gamma-carboxylase [Planococcus antarcticus DSM 14505]
MQKNLEISFYKLSNSQYHLIGLSILRIVIGLHLLWQLLLSFPIREELWQSHFLNPNIDILHANFSFNFFYFAGIFIMIFYTLGLGNFLFKLLTYLFVLLLYAASPFLGDGGSNILMIVLAYMIFTNNSAYFSLFSKKCSQNPFSRITHNLFLILILIQTCILYFFAGFFKAQGAMWLHGTALYYILNIDSFRMLNTNFLTEIVINSSFLLTVGAYSAIFLQLFFPLIVFNKYLKYLVLVGSIFFHLGIAFLMGLVQFGMIMIALDLLFLNDKEYKFIYGTIFKKRNLIKSRLFKPHSVNNS